MHTPTTPILGRTADSRTVWYTGRAGAAFISENAQEAFLYDSVEGARRRATMLNGGTALHGIRFVAVTGDLAQEAAR